MYAINEDGKLQAIEDNPELESRINNNYATRVSFLKHPIPANDIISTYSMMLKGPESPNKVAVKLKVLGQLFKYLEFDQCKEEELVPLFDTSRTLLYEFYLKIKLQE
jgi:hypothetical protein